MRPRQWVKTGLVVMAPMAAGALGNDDVPLRVGLAAVAFCMLASGIYPINDVRDAEEDRLHPRKRHRPVAAGEVSAAQAIALGVTLMGFGLVVCWLVRPLLVLVGAGYLVLTLSYTLIWRHVLILDVVAVGGGFVLRAVAGGVAAPVVLSRWFLLVISGAAVFLAAAKRYAELRRPVGKGRLRRRVLDSYSASAATAVVAYCGWASKVPAVHGIPWRPLTTVPFALCLLRYGAIVRAGGGEAPEEILLHDRLLQLAGIAWLVLFALGVNAVG
jgi:decaprenyl-phosphate phosphoribosyltransferase